MKKFEQILTDTELSKFSNVLIQTFTTKTKGECSDVENICSFPLASDGRINIIPRK